MNSSLESFKSSSDSCGNLHLSTRLSLQLSLQSQNSLENLKQQVMQNTVYLVILDPLILSHATFVQGAFVGCYGTLNDAAEAIIQEANENYICDIYDLDLEEGDEITYDHVTEFFKDHKYHIIPIMSLNRQKPIYITLDGNDYFKDISNENPANNLQSNPRQRIRTYNFS